jgi:hypothetical protein
MLLHTHHGKVDKNPPSQTWNIAKGHRSTSHLEFQLTFVGYINVTIVEGISEDLWVN